MPRKDDEPQIGGSPQEGAALDAKAAIVPDPDRVVSELDEELEGLYGFLSYLRGDIRKRRARNDQRQPLSKKVEDYIVALASATSHLIGELNPRERGGGRFSVGNDPHGDPNIIFSYGFLPKGDDDLALVKGTMTASCCSPEERKSVLNLKFQPSDDSQPSALIRFRTYPSFSNPGGIVHRLVINDPRVRIFQTLTVETSILDWAI